ncbi:MAG: GerMN domain-containing protein [bacterium]|nr:GerMN domain-containing protein [bacterium]
MSNKTAITLLIIVIGLAVIGGVYAGFNLFGDSLDTPEGSPDGKEEETVTLNVFFLDSKDPRSATDCGVTRSVTRVIPETPRVADAALKELFKGPTAAEYTAGLTTAFSPNPNTGEATKELGEYYRGVSIENGTAIVDFSETALGYLNSPACMQQAVKGPIIDTLKQFTTIDEVEFSIDGEIYTEWDA